MLQRRSLDDPPSGTAHATVLVVGGAVCGLAWSAGLRAYMVELAGPESAFTWAGTFGALLAPGALAGGLLGWAEHLRRNGRGTRRSWLVLATLPLAVAPLTLPGALPTLAATGEGSGAFAVAALAGLGGYALSDRGRPWSRAVAGALSVATVGGLAATVPVVTQRRLTLADPRGAWAAALAASLFVVLAAGSSIPLRR